MEVTLYTRQNCPLCEKAKDTLRAEGVTPNEVDIDLDLDLLRRFNDDVPVIYVDGSEAFRHRVDAHQLRTVVAGWRVIDRHHLEKEFRFADFAGALTFVNKTGAIAEQLNHHPDILLGWGRARVTTWSHDVDGLTDRDWRLAARIEEIARG